MNLRIIERNGHKIAEVVSEDVEISSVQDSLDLMADADYQGARSVILYERNLSPEFFDLKTRVAGEILQKHANYRFRLAIVGDFEATESNALRAFITECNRGSHIFFVKDRESALARLT